MRKNNYLLLIFCIFVIGCKTIEPSSEKIYIHDSIYIEKEKVIIDSVFIYWRDTVNIIQNGDTIIKTITKWRDTTNKYKSDTLEKDNRKNDTYENIKKVIIKNEMNGFQRFFFVTGILFIVVVIIWILFKLKKRFF